jgi:hypothetical protein
MPSNKRYPIAQYPINHTNALENLFRTFTAGEGRQPVAAYIQHMTTHTGTAANTQLRKLQAYLTECRRTQFPNTLVVRVRELEASGEWIVGVTTQENVQYPGTADFFFTIRRKGTRGFQFT